MTKSTPKKPRRHRCPFCERSVGGQGKPFRFATHVDPSRVFWWCAGSRLTVGAAWKFWDEMAAETSGEASQYEAYITQNQVPGFSRGVLGSPRLYERPDAADKITPKAVRDQVRRFGKRSPRPA